MSKNVKKYKKNMREKKLEKSNIFKGITFYSKNHFFKIWNFLRKTQFWRKQEENKCYSLSFANQGDQSSTRALMSTPFKNQGGSPERHRQTNGNPCV